jgi:hypothetical protein
VARAEEAEKRLSEKINELQAVKVQLRDAKVGMNDYRLKLD